MDELQKAMREFLKLAAGESEELRHILFSESKTTISFPMRMLGRELYQSPGEKDLEVRVTIEAKELAPELEG